MLLLLYSLNEAVARIRSFVFCVNLVEVTEVFNTTPVEETLVRIQKGIGLDILFGRTDYGQALRDFEEGWLDTGTPKTTVLILGDGRNNYGNPRTEILKTMHDRCRRLIWLNPEPPPFWNTGDSEMKRYRPYCSFVQNCSTVSHLERVVGLLLRSPV
jgi:uncharacterized protein with von Willebrand factor type A (vWA) domain